MIRGRLPSWAKERSGSGSGSGYGSGYGYGYGSGYGYGYGYDSGSRETSEYLKSLVGTNKEQRTLIEKNGNKVYSHDPELFKLPFEQVEILATNYIQERYNGEWWYDIEGNIIVRPRAAHEPLSMPGMKLIPKEEVPDWL